MLKINALKNTNSTKTPKEPKKFETKHVNVSINFMENNRDTEIFKINKYMKFEI